METLIFAGIGLVVGLAGGLFGIGGGIVLIPALTEIFGPHQHKYQAASMIVGFFVTTPAVYQHFRAGAIDLGSVGRFLPIAAVAVIGGVLMSEAAIFSGAGEAYLRLIFGTFLLYSAVTEGTKILLRILKPEPFAPKKDPKSTTWSAAALVAVPTGLVAGLLGVGGGIIAVPLQRRLLGTDLRRAIANSATIIIATALIGSITKNYAYITGSENGLAPLKIAAAVVPTAVIGSLIGSRLTYVVPVRALKGLFLVLLLIAAVRICYFAIASLG